MKDKYLKNSLLLILLLIMSVVVMGQNQALGILGIVLSLVAFGAEISFSHRQNWRVRRQISQISQEVEGLNQEKLYDLPLPMVVTSDAGLVILANKCFTQCFGLETEAEGKYVHELTGVTLKTLEEGKPHTFTWKDNEYLVIDTRFSRDGQPLHLLHFADLRIRKEAGRKNRPNETVFAYILIDNYDDIIEQLPAMERSTVLSRVTISLTDWANRLDAFILEYENDHYVMIFERDKLVEMEDEKFKILDEVRELGDSMRVTLSIGIGVSEKHLSVTEMDELSHAALDFALARGGDQCVVRNDEKMSFYGGKTEATEKRTKVKARVKAHALRELVRNADNVLIMGHQTPDMDCVGSAVGLMGACRAMD
jgi:c-di-AMP phosphodiesterase-like protein